VSKPCVDIELIKFALIPPRASVTEACDRKPNQEGTVGALNFRIRTSLKYLEVIHVLNPRRTSQFEVMKRLSWQKGSVSLKA
jgi:hypothetical protein